MELKKFSGVLYLSDNERFARHCGQGKISMKIPDHCVQNEKEPLRILQSKGVH